MLIDAEIAARVDRLEIPFNAYGVDRYGVSKEHLSLAFTALSLLSRRYFRAEVYGARHVPARGRAMLVGNHSGGVALDAMMVVTSMFLDMEPPRLAQGMAEKFINRLPFLSTWANRIGQFTGLPEHAATLLEDERLLLVFPEGARGTAKLYPARNSLVGFGTGFMRLAMKTKTPIIPLGFVGGGEAIPTVVNAYELGKLLGVPYVPITPYLLPIPLPVRVAIHYGEPMVFEGTGNEEDELIARHVDAVKAEIAKLIERGRAERRASLQRSPRR